MEFQDAVDKHLPMAVNKDGYVAITTDIMIEKDNVAFFEGGWCSNVAVGRNPMDFASGEIQGEGPWRIGDTVFELMHEGHQLEEYLQRWNEYRSTPEGKELSSWSRAREFLKRALAED